MRFFIFPRGDERCSEWIEATKDVSLLVTALDYESRPIQVPQTPTLKSSVPAPVSTVPYW